MKSYESYIDISISAPSGLCRVYHSVNQKVDECHSRGNKKKPVTNPSGLFTVCLNTGGFDSLCFWFVLFFVFALSLSLSLSVTLFLSLCVSLRLSCCSNYRYSWERERERERALCCRPYPHPASPAPKRSELEKTIRYIMTSHNAVNANASLKHWA